MVRKLDKIEKEMGYCEIKLEKERRLRKQVDFLKAEFEALGQFTAQSQGVPKEIGALPFPEIGHRISLERQTQEDVGPQFLRARADFVGAGVVELVNGERDVLRREIGEIDAKFESFSGFVEKRDLLRQEKEMALDCVSAQSSERLRKISEEFKVTERLWNSLTEDALNLDEALFFLSRSVDYITSSRSFLIAAKGSFDIENWIEDGYLTDLFRHSNVGRAKEMVEGANRNLKLAQKELVCAANFQLEIGSFEPVLVQFLGALFDDIFLDVRIERSVSVIEEAITAAQSWLKAAQDQRVKLHANLESTESVRTELFQALGGERRGRVAMS